MAKSAQIIEVAYEYEGLLNWAHIGPSGATIPIGTVVGFRVKWENTGDENLQARVYFTVTDPNGVTTTINPDVYYLNLVPDESTFIYFDGVGLANVGNYTIAGRVVEYGETANLDSFSFPITVSSVPSNGDGGITSVLTSVMPLIMIVMIMGMMMPMFKGMSKGFE